MILFKWQISRRLLRKLMWEFPAAFFVTRICTQFCNSAECTGLRPVWPQWPPLIGLINENNYSWLQAHDCNFCNGYRVKSSSYYRPGIIVHHTSSDFYSAHVAFHNEHSDCAMCVLHLGSFMRLYTSPPVCPSRWMCVVWSTHVHTHTHTHTHTLKGEMMAHVIY